VPRRIIVHFLNEITDDEIRDLTNHFRNINNFNDIFIDSERNFRVNHQRGHIKDDMYVPHIIRKVARPRRAQTVGGQRRNQGQRDPNFQGQRRPQQQQHNVTSPKIDYTSIKTDLGGAPKISGGNRPPQVIGGGNMPPQMNIPQMGGTRINQMGIKPMGGQNPMMGGGSRPMMGGNNNQQQQGGNNMGGRPQMGGNMGMQGFRPQMGGPMQGNPSQIPQMGVQGNTQKFPQMGQPIPQMGQPIPQMGIPKPNTEQKEEKKQ